MTKIVKCRGCGAKIVWLKTMLNANMPVDSDTYTGELLYNRLVHRSHWLTCPKSKEFRKRREFRRYQFQSQQ